MLVVLTVLIVLILFDLLLGDSNLLSSCFEAMLSVSESAPEFRLEGDELENGFILRSQLFFGVGPSPAVGLACMTGMDV